MNTVIPCTGMHTLKPKLFGNICTIKRAFWPYIYLDPSRILVYQYPFRIRINIWLKARFMVHIFPNNLGFNACIPVQGITVYICR